MIIRSPISILSKFGPILLVGSLAWLGWDSLGPRKPEAGPARRELAGEMTPEMLHDLHENRGSVRNAALLHLRNDPTDYITNSLRSTIEHSGIFDLRDTTSAYKARSLFRMRHRTYDTLDKALERGRSLDAESVIFGTVHAFESSPEGAVVDIEITLAETASGDTLLNKRYNRKLPASALSAVSGVRAGSAATWLTRLLAWVLIVLLLPVVSISFIRAMVRKESNGINVSMLGIYTAFDVLLAFLLLGAAPASWVTLAVILIAGGAALFYNYKIMEFALKLEA